MSNHTFAKPFRTRKMRWTILSLSAFSLSVLGLLAWQQKAPKPLTPTANTTTRIEENYGRLPLYFEANHGQVDAQVKFMTRANGHDLFLTPREAVLALKKKDHTSALRMKLIGAQENPAIKGEEKLAGTTNYFLGNDPAGWRTNVATYARVKYESVYPGVDVVYYGNQQQLEYDFLVAPGADPKAIKLGFAGAESLALDEQGNLVVTTATGKVIQHKPIVYQEADGKRQEIAGNYVLQDNQQVSFAVGEYDASKTLVIDPVLSYATFFGPGPGPDVDSGYSTTGTDIKVDEEGNAYITGTFRAPEFPLSSDAVRPQRLYRDDAYIFIAKFNPQGSGLLYSAVIGGVAHPGAATPFALAIDDEGSAYITGWNGWRDFPVTRGVFASLGSIFVTKLNPTGTELAFSTVLGGDGFNEEGSGIAVDREHNVYVTGHSDSKRFPVTPNAYQKENAGWADGFVMKLKPDGSQLIYSTLIGGGLHNTVVTPVVDAQGNVYFAGDTQGIEDGRRADYKPFPTTPDAFMSSTDPQVLLRGGAYSGFQAS
ncbi:MAG: SBBP repeat-containing protein, partial [Acidobacteria bacterium]|nr:SBBP repeat-containing protein [Acidobacteriota bacterium]